MLFSVDINYLAVLAMTVFSLILGSVWYGPLFGKQWMSAMKVPKAEIDKAKKKGMKGMWKSYLFQFVGSLVMVYILAMFVKYSGSTTLLNGALVGLWIGVGFSAAKNIGSVIWEGRPKSLYLINTFYDIVFLMISGAVLAVW